MKKQKFYQAALLISMTLFLSLSAEASFCGGILSSARLEFSVNDFVSSEFGNTHAQRPGDHAFSNWSAEVANELYGELKKGASAEELFKLTAQARNDFARKHEGVKDPVKEGYGVFRRLVTDKTLGVDNIGVSSITLSLRPAVQLEVDYEFPNKYWKEFAAKSSRTEWANRALIALRESDMYLSDLSPELLIVDRHYQTLNQEVYRIGGTRIHKALPGLDESPYFVNTLNLTVKEVEVIFSDVWRRVDLVLDSNLSKEERAGHLRLAMYAFFNAMPYYRGSAAIGRILFTVVASEVMGRNIHIHPEVDVQAIINTALAFGEQVEL